MYKWYRSASGVNGPSTEILPCHEVALPLRCSAAVVLFGRTEVIGLLELPMWDGNDKRVVPLANTKDIGDDENAGTDVRKYGTLMQFLIRRQCT